MPDEITDHQVLGSYLAEEQVNGFTVNCPESQTTVTADMREIGPTYYFAPPRVLEALLTQVTIRMEDAAPFKRRLFAFFMTLARRVGERILDGDASVGAGDRLLYGLLRRERAPQAP